MSLDKGFGSTLDKIKPIKTAGLADDSVTDAKVKAHTTTKITVPLATQVSGLLGNSNLANLPTLGTNPSPARQTAITNAELAGSIALSKLLTPPETNATADQTGAEIKTLYEGEANAYTDTKDTKLSGIATAATANDTDANLKARANHTGTQTASTISDFDT